MKRAALCLTVALLSGLVTRDLSAQRLPGSDYGSLSVHVGVLSPQTTYEDASFGESKFESGMALGGSATIWPTRGRWGLHAALLRSKTEGWNSTSEFAPIAVNDPTQWLASAELVVRQPMELGSLAGFPYLSAGVGAKQYNWEVSVHQEDRAFLWTVAAGFDARHSMLGPLALTAEARSYFSKFKAFGIDDGTWEPGFYGGKVGGVSSTDLLFSTGLSLTF